MSEEKNREEKNKLDKVAEEALLIRQSGQPPLTTLDQISYNYYSPTGTEEGFNVREIWLVVARCYNLPFKIERIGLRSILNRKLIDLAGIEHPPSQLGRLTQGNRQHPRGERIERPAVTDLDLAIACRAKIALYRRHGLR